MQPGVEDGMIFFFFFQMEEGLGGKLKFQDLINICLVVCILLLPF